MKSDVLKVNLSKKYNIKEQEIEAAINKIKNKEVVFYAMSGKMGAGKDTIGDGILKILKDKGLDVVCMSYSTPMRKEILNITKDFNQLSCRELTEKYSAPYSSIVRLIEILNNEDIYERTVASRNAIQFWGTDVRRKQNYNYWVNKLTQLSIENINKGKSVYISDTRFPNEVDSIIDLDGKVIRLEVNEETRSKRIVDRDNLQPTMEHLNHSSETGLDNYKFDRVFDGCLPIEELVTNALNYIES